MAELSSAFTYLSSKQRIERDKGIAIIKELLKNPNEAMVENVERSVRELLSHDTWEGRHGALMATGALVSAEVITESLVADVEAALPELLEFKEPRVRLAAGEVLGQLCRCCGGGVFLRLRDVILSGIQSNLERYSSTSGDCRSSTSEDYGTSSTEEGQVFSPSAEDRGDGTDTAGGSNAAGSGGGQRSIGSPVERQETYGDMERPQSPSSAVVLHDTAGWKTLETYMNALQQAVSGCGMNFAPHVTSDLLVLMYTCLEHTNRFVRETGYKTLAAIVMYPDLPRDVVGSQWQGVAQQLVIGLSDNWSQVRMAASVATREFLTATPPPGGPDSSPEGLKYLPILLPPMCLNRYYVAEGVKLYSQETWRLVTKGRGVALVEENIEGVVKFYVRQSQASNHAVREAACACIAELGAKVSADCLRPHVVELVAVLLECFRDDSWPVRDAACLASGNFVNCFPVECKDSVDVLFPLFLSNLEDSIPSVRQGAAVAIAQLLAAYGSEVEEKIFTVLQDRLPQVSSQPSDQSTPSIDPSPAPFGVVQRAGQLGVATEDDVARTNQQMYSCGSLAPKMKRGGCMDANFHRAAQPWERSDGCVHLLAVLSQQSKWVAHVEQLLPVLSEACRARHYPQHLNFLESVLGQLPVIAKSLGKRVFKRHLELFLEPVFYSFSCDSALVKAAGTQCLNDLTKLVGRMIMRGRIELQNSQWLQVFDQVVR